MSEIILKRGKAPLNGPAVTANQLRTIRMQGNCCAPIDAKAVSVNVTVVSPSSAGWLGEYPSTGFSCTSTININADEVAIANVAIVPLSSVATAGNSEISALWGNYSGTAPQTHVLLDVTCRMSGNAQMMRERTL